MVPLVISVHHCSFFTAVLLLQGVRRPPLPDYLEVRKYFAVHECGKALVATKLREQTGRLEQVERVSIVPRGRSVASPSCILWCMAFLSYSLLAQIQRDANRLMHAAILETVQHTFKSPRPVSKLHKYVKNTLTTYGRGEAAPDDN